MTKEEAIHNHRKMWSWMADETEREKRKVHEEEYFKDCDKNLIPFMNCYCCEYSLTTLKDMGLGFTCMECPINWNVGSIPMICIDFWIMSWAGLHDNEWEKAVDFARQIANLPESK